MTSIDERAARLERIAAGYETTDMGIAVNLRYAAVALREAEAEAAKLRAEVAILTDREFIDYMGEPVVTSDAALQEILHLRAELDAIANSLMKYSGETFIPRCTEEYPAGMSATEAVEFMAREHITLRAERDIWKETAELTRAACDVYRRTTTLLVAERDEANANTVTLCGSTRFKAAYIDWYQRLTDQGFIVLTVGRFLPKRDHTTQLKVDLDALHLRKIDRSSRIFVLDVGGYIGDSTRREIAHAERTGKTVEYLSQFPEYVEPPLASTDIGLAVESEWKSARAEAVEVVRRGVSLLNAVSEEIPRRPPDGSPSYVDCVINHWTRDARAFLAKHAPRAG